MLLHISITEPRIGWYPCVPFTNLPSKAFMDVLLSHIPWTVACAVLIWKQAASTYSLFRTVSLCIIPRDNWSGIFCFTLTVIQHIENSCKTIRNTHGLLKPGLYSLNCNFRVPYINKSFCLLGCHLEMHKRTNCRSSSFSDTCNIKRGSIFHFESSINLGHSYKLWYLLVDVHVNMFMGCRSCELFDEFLSRFI